jgi:DNA-binding LacI/PurR family transcriptional regulator
MGRRAVRILIERIEKRAQGPVVQHIFAPTLCVRDSCIRH